MARRLLGWMSPRILYYRFKYPSLKLEASVRIGGNCSFAANTVALSRASLSNVELGRCSYCGADTYILETKVGAFCSIGPGAMIGLGRHPIHLASTSPSFYSNRESRLLNLTTQPAIEEISLTTIGNDVWIGARAIILGGLQIGDGAVIGAGAVVTRNVESFAVVGGVPARILRARFAPDVAEMLRESKWWDLPISDLKEIADQAVDPAEFARSASAIWGKRKVQGN